VLHHGARNSGDQRPKAAAVWVQGYLMQNLAAPATGGPAEGGHEPDLLPRERNEKPHVCLQQLLELSPSLHPCKVTFNNPFVIGCGCITAVGAEALSFYAEKLSHRSQTQRLVLSFKEDGKYKGKKEELHIRK
jgi:hypothetical protein